LTARDHEELYWNWKNATGDEKELAASLLHKALLGYATTIVWRRMRHAPRDLVSDIVSTALLSEPSFKGNSKFTTWFFALADALTCKYLQKIRRRRECPLLIQDDFSLPDPLVSPSQTKMDPKLQSHLAVSYLSRQLAPQERALLEAILDGWTWRQYAEKLGVHPQAMKTRWRRLKLKLRSLSQR
jgi:RNA polymerase sigma factor (sigma-70 family)